MARSRGNCTGLQRVKYCIFSSVTTIWLLQPNYSYRHVQIIQTSIRWSIHIKRKKRQKCCYSKGVVPSTLWLPTSSRAAKRLQVHGRAIVVFMRGPDFFVLSTRFPMPTRQHVGMLTHALRRLMHDFVVDAFDDVAIEGSLAIVQPSIITAQHLCRKLPSRAHRSSPSTRSVDVRHEE